MAQTSFDYDLTIRAIRCYIRCWLSLVVVFRFCDNLKAWEIGILNDQRRGLNCSAWSLCQCLDILRTRQLLLRAFIPLCWTEPEEAFFSQPQAPNLSLPVPIRCNGHGLPM